LAALAAGDPEPVSKILAGAGAGASGIVAAEKLNRAAQSGRAQHMWGRSGLPAIEDAMAQSPESYGSPDIRAELARKLSGR
jgi:hypothetical protein